MIDITTEEAVKILEICSIDYSNNNKYQVAFDMAIKELKKNIAIEPIQPKDKIRYGMGYSYHDFYCPTCGSFLVPEPKGLRWKEEGGLSSCDICGQKIKWYIEEVKADDGN